MSELQKCPVCDGRGWWEMESHDADGPTMSQRECSACKGSGTYEDYEIHTNEVEQELAEEHARV